MAKYYYDMFSATLTTTYSEGSRVYEKTFPNSQGSVFGHPAYGFSSSAGYSISGVENYIAGDSPKGKTLFHVYASNPYKLMVYVALGNNGGGLADSFTSEAARKDVYNKGTLILANIVAEDGTYPTNGRHIDGYWYVRGAVANAIPTLSLATTDNRTLYENDTLGISGSATDSDSGNVVSVKYQLNGGTERAITSGISTGASIPFNRSLTYKGGMLYDGPNAVTPALAESTTHSLKVWAEDDKGGKSAVQTRLFTVVANRPATLTIEPFVTTGNLIDSDTMTIKGNVVDPESNTVVVRYKVGSGSYVEVLNGVGGPFTISIALSALKAGANAVTIQATDSYGAVSSKTLSIVKSGSVQPLKTSVVRYKINPPNGSAKGVLLWVEREVGDLIVNAEISATMAGEAESFVPMTKTSTAFVTDGVEEDEFTHDAVTPKDNLVVKLTMTRSSAATNSGIKLISGVLS